MSHDSHKNRMAALPLMLLVVLVRCQAAAPSPCRCGIDAREQLQYLGPTADNGFPYPRIVEISREGERKAIQMEVLLPRSKDSMLTGLKSFDQGATWIPSPTYRKAQWQSSSHPRVLYRIDHDSYLRSTDQGQNWVELKLLIDGHTKEDFGRRFSQKSGSRLRMALAAIHPSDPYSLYATFSIWVNSHIGSNYTEVIDVPGMYVSHNGGDHWTFFSPSVGNVRKGSDISPILGISPSNSDRMIAHGTNGLIRSKDGGKTWSPVGQQSELEKPAEQKGRAEAIADLRKKGEKTPIPEVAPVAKFQISQIEFHPNDSRLVYLVTNKGLYRSDDGGDSWCLFLFGPPKLDSITSLTFDPDDPRQIFVGMEMTVMVSTDSGCHFRKFFDYEQFAATHRLGR